jgi:alpha-glucosidase
MNEPATGDIPAERMRFGNGEFSHERYHNSYALLMAMGTVQGLNAAMPDLRTFVLSRAGSAGIQRYAANWMGDNFSRWDHLWVSIPMGAGLSLSGQLFVGADIGGFAEDSNPELFARWIQYGALTPFARNHNQANQLDQYAFSFGPEVLQIARDAIKLRYRLMPYLYSAFVAASRDGSPIQRPLIYEYQYDSETVNLDDEYLLGGDLLVAPVLEPGASSRSVYLPEGEWYDWHTGNLIQGKQRVKVDAPLDTIPLFAKAGAVIPMWTEAPKSTYGYYPSSIELRVFVPSIDGTHMSVLTEDDGLTFAATGSKESFLETQITVARAGRQLTLTGLVSGNSFPEFVRKDFRINLVGAGIREVIVLENTGEAFSLTIQL